MVPTKLMARKNLPKWRLLNRSDRVRLRRATSADAERLSVVQTETWKSSYRHIFPAEFLDGLVVRRERWVERMVGGLAVHVAEVDHLIAGYCTVAPADDAGWGELRAIYVHPAHQGAGLGSELLSAGLEELRRAGFAQALLWVIDQNRQARSFYENRGWRQGRPIRLEEIGGTPVTLVRYERAI